jgi:hypothetical protein
MAQWAATEDDERQQEMGASTSQELKKVLIKIYCIKKCLLDLDPI